jgi:hypothetical protein
VKEVAWDWIEIEIEIENGWIWEVIFNLQILSFN